MFDGPQPEVTFEQDCPEADDASCQISLNKRTRIDVSEMNALYLQMDISAPVYQAAKDLLAQANVPTTIRTDDPSTSERLYVDGVQQAKNKAIDIYRIVGCGKETDQSWEDGGGWDERDFSYSVEGYCVPSTKDKGVILLQ